MSNQDLVSIIMPLYNGKKHINEAIDSVISQTYANWELIIIDDCSTDGSDEIALFYANNNPKIFFYKTSKNGGPAQARNIGTSNAKGKFICFLDSDDVWFNNKLEVQVNFILKNNAEIVFSNYEKISHLGIRNRREVILPSKVSYNDLLKINSIPCLTVIYDASKLGKLFQNADQYFVAYEDYIMWLSVLKKGYFAINTNEVLAFYRIAENSLSRNKLKMIKIRWSLYRKIERLNFIKSIYNMLNYIILGFVKYMI